MSADLCHECSCHLSPPCGQCVECNHPDGDVCPEGDCQNCECIERPVYVPPTPEELAMYARSRERRAMLEAMQYVGKPYSKKEWGYASVSYTIRPEVNGERLQRVVGELIAKHTYFGHRQVGRFLTIYVD